MFPKKYKINFRHSPQSTEWNLAVEPHKTVPPGGDKHFLLRYRHVLLIVIQQKSTFKSNPHIQSIHQQPPRTLKKKTHQTQAKPYLYFATDRAYCIKRFKPVHKLQVNTPCYCTVICDGIATTAAWQNLSAIGQSCCWFVTLYNRYKLSSLWINKWKKI